MIPNNGWLASETWTLALSTTPDGVTVNRTRAWPLIDPLASSRGYRGSTFPATGRTRVSSRQLGTTTGRSPRVLGTVGHGSASVDWARTGAGVSVAMSSVSSRGRTRNRSWVCPNARVQLRGVGWDKSAKRTVQYLMLGYNLMPFAPVCCNT